MTVFRKSQFDEYPKLSILLQEHFSSIEIISIDSLHGCTPLFALGLCGGVSKRLTCSALLAAFFCLFLHLA